MTKITSVCLIILACMTLTSQEPAPKYKWNFERSGFIKVNNREVSPGGNGKNMPASFITEDGYHGGYALESKDDDRRRQFTGMNITWPEFTMELRFMTTLELSKASRGTTLAYYMTHSWNRRCMDWYITKDNKMGVEFRLYSDDGKERIKYFKMEGEPFDFKPGIWYTVRLAAKSGDKCQLWLNDALYQEADKAMSFNDFIGKYPEAYPLLILGNAFPGDKNIKRLIGKIDDVRIWDKVVAPGTVPPDAFTGNAPASAGDPNLVIKISDKAPTLDGNLDEPFWKDAEWTVPFTVLDVAAAALGAFEKADTKFIDNAGRAAVACDGKNLYLALQNPIPDGVQVKATCKKDGDSIWADDCNEFFIRPDGEKPLFFQYLINADGWKKVIKHSDVGVSDINFVTKAIAKTLRTPKIFTTELSIPLDELGIKNIKDAGSITVNFTRCGPTAGGLSTWAPVGNNFANPSRFGKLLSSSRKEYFGKRLSEVEQELAGLKVTAEAKASVKDQFNAFRKVLDAQGDAIGSWDTLNVSLLNLRNSLARLVLAGRPFILWEGQPWANTPPSMPVPMTAKPLTEVRLRTVRNAKTIFGFAFSNLGEKPMMPRIKVVPEPIPDNSFRYNTMPAKDTDANKLATHIVFKEGLPMEDVSAQTIPDPLAPLVLNSVFRCQPGCTVPLWMEVDTRNLDAGNYWFNVMVRPTYRNVPPQHFTVNLIVEDIDLDTVPEKQYNYYYANIPAGFKVLAQYGYNFLYCGTPGQASLDIYPRFDKDGNVLINANFSQLDFQIDNAVASGIKLETLRLIFMVGFDYTWHRHLPVHDANGVRNTKGERLTFATPQWQKAFTAWIHQMKEHLASKYKITMDRVFINPEDESTGLPDEKDSPMYVALESCRLIKQADPNIKTMLNPFFGSGKLGDLDYVFKRLAEHTDIIEFYRPHLNADPKLLDLAKKHGNFEFWIYHILSKSTAPLTYRRLYWENLADKFTSVCAYWHWDSHAGGDGLNSFDGGKHTTDYGVVYYDVPSNQMLTSRRSEAWLQGFIDFRLAKLCANRIDAAAKAGKDVTAWKKQLKDIQTQAMKADIVTMSKLQEQLIDLAVNIGK